MECSQPLRRSLLMRLRGTDHQVRLSPVHSFVWALMIPCDIFQYQRLYSIYIFFLQTLLVSCFFVPCSFIVSCPFPVPFSPYITSNFFFRFVYSCGPGSIPVPL